MSEAHVAAIDAHPLRREIVTTVIVNRMVNHAGLSFVHRMWEETSAVPADIVRAHLCAAEVFGLYERWERIDALGRHLGLVDQIDLFLALRRLVERSALWLLRHRRSPIDIERTIAGLRDGVTAAGAVCQMSGIGGDGTASARLVAAGVPADLATEASAWPYLHTSLDVVEVSHRTGTAVEAVATAYWSLFAHLDIAWLWERIDALPRADRWQSQARAALHDDLLSEVRALTEQLIAADGTDDAAAWLDAQGPVVRRAQSALADIRAHGAIDLATLTVALRQLRNLAVPVAS
jgi:glutamate dehydrogenase